MSPAEGATEARPHECLICHASFPRVDHLKRHTKLHTGKKQYQCSCGDAFSRNDVLAQHLRRCDKARDHQDRRVAQQTRSKRACDRCAKLKMKCNSQHPCDHCRQKSIVCEFTRRGYVDPYKEYRVGHGSPPTSVEGGIDSCPIDSVSSMVSESQYISLQAIPLDRSSGQSMKWSKHDSQHPNSHLAQIQISETTLLPSPQSTISNPIQDLDLFDYVNIDALPMDFGFGPMFDWEAVGQFEHFDSLETLSPNSEALRSAASRHHSKPSGRGSFSIEQMDPVEAKCAAIRTLLQDSEPLVTKDMISTYMTRENLLLCVQLYSIHFQRNFPILHSPTFNLIKTPPILLLAILLCGACYSDGLISAGDITKFAMRLLIVIENQPHEIDMQVPSLSTIQASIISCGVLVCSRNKIACRFVSVHFARNISMADRAGVFDAVSSIDYNMLTEGAFDWALWIEQESRRRIACEILCQDMAACVFQGKSPSFSPLNFQVELPCYETCWEAQTSSECFQRLLKIPRQIRVSEASRHLRTSSVESAPLFEASAFGMFTLILGLHGFLSQTIQEDIEPNSYAAATPFTDIHSHSIQNHHDEINYLHQNFSGAFVASLADSAVSTHGSAAIKRLNTILDAWRATWDLRHARDYEQENVTFSGDPLPFWWLAKLYLALHVHASAVSDESEFAIPRAEAKDESGKIALQEKIIGWLSRFRRDEKRAEMAGDTSVLPTLMKPL